jgi:hypothetical protein
VIVIHLHRRPLWHGGPCMKRWHHHRPLCPLPSPRHR